LTTQNTENPNKKSHEFFFREDFSYRFFEDESSKFPKGLLSPIKKENPSRVKKFAKILMNYFFRKKTFQNKNEKILGKQKNSKKFQTLENLNESFPIKY